MSFGILKLKVKNVPDEWRLRTVDKRIVMKKKQSRQLQKHAKMRTKQLLWLQDKAGGVVLNCMQQCLCSKVIHNLKSSPAKISWRRKPTTPLIVVIKAWCVKNVAFWWKKWVCSIARCSSYYVSIWMKISNDYLSSS